MCIRDSKADEEYRAKKKAEKEEIRRAHACDDLICEMHKLRQRLEDVGDDAKGILDDLAKEDNCADHLSPTALAWMRKLAEEAAKVQAAFQTYKQAWEANGMDWQEEAHKKKLEDCAENDEDEEGEEGEEGDGEEDDDDDEDDAMLKKKEGEAEEQPTAEDRAFIDDSEPSKPVPRQEWRQILQDQAEGRSNAARATDDEFYQGGGRSSGGGAASSSSSNSFAGPSNPSATPQAPIVKKKPKQ